MKPVMLVLLKVSALKFKDLYLHLFWFLQSYYHGAAMSTDLLTDSGPQSLEVNVHPHSNNPQPHAGMSSSIKENSQSNPNLTELSFNRTSSKKLQRRPPVDRNQRPKKLYVRKPASHYSVSFHTVRLVSSVIASDRDTRVNRNGDNS